jgi:hypothetical protein
MSYILYCMFLHLYLFSETHHPTVSSYMEKNITKES